MPEGEKREIIQYGMERIKVILISISVTLFIGYIFGVLYQSIVFLLSFYPLRRYAGGYHAKTQKNCFLISFCIVIISLGMLSDVTQQGINILFVFIKHNLVTGIIISIGITSIALISGVVQNRKINNVKISYEKSTRI